MKKSTGGGASSKNGANTLMAAVVAKDIRACEIALKGGADVNRQDDHGWTPLRKATRAGDLNMVGFLIENNADVTAGDQVTVLTASSWGRADVLKQLLDAKANVGPDTEWEVTPLIAAAENGHTRVMKVLLEYGADVNQEDKSGNDPLMAAWDANRAEIVLFLVERGANLKKASDWVRLAASPVTAAQIAEGINRRNLRRIMDDENAGMTTADTYNPGIRIPLDALCRWIELVPKAAVTFLDKVLLTAPKDSPVRADMHNVTMRTAYININDWVPKEEPLLLRLAPKNQFGGGTPVSCQILHQHGILNKDVLFSVSRSDSYVFKSFALQGLLQHCWESHALPRFVLDFVLEIVTILMLVFWTYITHSGIPYSFLMVICVVLLALVVLCDFLDEMRQLKYYSHAGVMRDYFNNWGSSTGGCASRYIRIALGFMSIILAILSGLANNDYDDTNVMLDARQSDNKIRPAFDIVFSLTVYSRWNMLIAFFRGTEKMGPLVIPITNTLNFIGPFLLILCVYVLCFYHVAIGLRLGGSEDLLEIFIDQWRLLTVRDFAFEQFTNSDNVNFYYVQVAVFIIASFLISICLLNIFIAIILEAFDFQQDMALNNFIQNRNHLCIKYFFAMESTLLAPVDFILRKTISIFKPVTEDKYLWMTCPIDESQGGRLSTPMTEAEDTTRLGWVKKVVRESFKSVFKKLDEDVLDSEQNLKKRWTLVARELKNLSTESKENINRLVQHIRRNEDSEGDEESASELDAVAEQSEGSA